VDRLDETAEDDESYSEAATEALTAARSLSAPLTPEERGLLSGLRDWARIAQDRPDAKFGAFRQWLDPVVCPQGPRGDWTKERVIVFTEYRDTQRWLYERLIAAGVPEDRIAMLFGGQDEEQREHVKSVFRESPELSPIRILLATDAASEGINLQSYCHRLLHWEIPWNPNRLEQRNGRIDRHGQKRRVGRDLPLRTHRLAGQQGPHRSGPITAAGKRRALRRKQSGRGRGGSL